MPQANNPDEANNQSKINNDGALDEQRLLIAQRLRAAREQAGLSQGQVARKLGKHRPSISEAEAGRRSVPAEELAELARMYGVSASWLAGGGSGDTEANPRVELAARELAKLKPDDLERLMQLLATLRTNEE